VVAGFATGGIAFIKLIGIGMIVAIVVERHAGPGAAGAGDDAAARPVELVGAGSTGEGLPAVRRACEPNRHHSGIRAGKVIMAG
jgi:hypothetical protein